MFYFVGLGNAYKKYLLTRHNAGMDLLEQFKKEDSFMFEYAISKQKYIIRSFKYKNKEFFTVKLNTYMNLSGEVLKLFCKEQNVALSEICIVVDDFNLDFGKFRIRLRGSSGAHKGLQSIINVLETQEFARIRIGIGPCRGVSENFVLDKFSKDEQQKLPEIFQRLCEIVKSVVEQGFEKTMNKFNSNSLPKANF